MKLNANYSLGPTFNKLSKHPFITTAAACLMLFFFGFCFKTSITAGSYIYAGAVLIVLLALLVTIGKIGGNTKEKVIFVFSAAVLSIGSLFIISKFDNSPSLILWLSILILAVIVFMMYLTDTLTPVNFIIIMIAAGIILRFVYTLYTSSGDRQHDVGFWNFTWGHANYIEYWYKNGLKLPDFDVRSIWQYYHPPLHHMLMAVMLKILTFFKMDYGTACQALQFLPFLYSSLTIVVCYKIFRLINLKNLPLLISMAIICFHPTFVIMGGFFNNDMLCVLFMMMSIMFALKWYRKPTLLNIIPIALSVGLGMMTKLSAWMVAPAIAVLFIYVFVKNIKSWSKYLGQFAVFGCICAPLGLWWQVRNLILFNVPLTYVPLLSDTDPQFCGNLAPAKRLLDFGNGQLNYVYDAFTSYGAPYNEYNPTLGLIKTALFDEGHNGITSTTFPQIAITGPILFWVGTVLAVLCAAAFFVTMLSKKTELDKITRSFFLIFAITLLVSYYSFCFQFPFTCTMNIRYCVPLIPMFAMGLGLLLRRFSGKSAKEKLLRYSSYALVTAFVLMTLILFSQIAVLIPTQTSG